MHSCTILLQSLALLYQNHQYLIPALEMDVSSFAIPRLPRHRPEPALDSTINRAPPCALRLRLDLSGAFRRQRNLRNSRTRDFRSSASGMKISVSIKQNNST